MMSAPPRRQANPLRTLFDTTYISSVISVFPRMLLYLAEKAKIFFPGGDTHMGKKKMISKKVTMVRKIFQKKKKIQKI